MRREDTIKVTSDYKIFQRMRGNREINVAHVRYLKQAFTNNKNALKYTPILVNEKLEIIDGQHRLFAAQQLGIPVYFIIHDGLDLSHVQALNSNNKPWRPIDYAKSHAEKGNINYKLYLDFTEQYPFNHDILRNVLSQYTSNTRAFKRGDFQVKNVKFATKFFDQLMDFKKYHKRFAQRPFAIAFYKIFENPSYDHKHMIEQLEKHPELLDAHTDPIDYIRNLEAIYNLSVRGIKRVRLY